MANSKFDKCNLYACPSHNDFHKAAFPTQNIYVTFDPVKREGIEAGTNNLPDSEGPKTELSERMQKFILLCFSPPMCFFLAFGLT